MHRPAFDPEAPVLLLHGVCCTGATLAPIAAAFRHGGRVVRAPTLCSALRSKAGVADDALVCLSLADLLSDARRHARDLATQTGRKPIIVGHSNGALLALALAGSGEAEGVVLVAPAPPPSVGGLPLWARRILFTRIFGRGWSDRAIRFDPRWPFRGDKPPGVLADTLCADSGRAMRDVLAASRGGAFDPSLPLPCAAVVIAGDRDRLVPLSLARALALRLDAPLIVCPLSGHWLIALPSGIETIVRSTGSPRHAGVGGGGGSDLPRTHRVSPADDVTNHHSARDAELLSMKS